MENNRTRAIRQMSKKTQQYYWQQLKLYQQSINAIENQIDTLKQRRRFKRSPQALQTFLLQSFKLWVNPRRSYHVLEKSFYIEFFVLNRPVCSRKQVWPNLFCELCLKYWRIRSVFRNTYERSRSHRQFGCLTLIFWAKIEDYQSSITSKGFFFLMYFDRNV